MKRRHLHLFAAALAGACVLPLAARAGGLPELIDKVRPGVVLVGTHAETDNPRFTFRGTGFAVGDGRHVITNVHVLPEALSTSLDDPARRRLSLRFSPRRGLWQELEAVEVVATDRERDLALLRFKGPALPALELADPAEAREGLPVILSGFPLGGALGFSLVTHRGMVSALTTIALPPPQSQQLNAAALRRLREGAFEILQLDATAYPGNSGGPVISQDSGKVVGVVNMVFVKGSRETALSQPSGISYAIPVSWVHQLMGAR